MRTSADGRGWSPWQPLQIEAVAEVATGREVFAALAGAPRARVAQYQATFQSDEPATLTAMTVTAINTECPGTTLKNYLPTLRTTVATRLNRGPAPTLSGPTQSQTLTAPASLSFTWGTEATLFCLEGWHKSSGSENILYLRGYADAGYGDALAKKQVWTDNPSSIVFSDLPAGHYTMHVRGPNSYEANLTYLVQ